MRNRNAGPSDRRTASISRGMICGSTTRIATCQVEAPSVCALTICSARQRADAEAKDRGSETARRRMTIRTTLDKFAESEHDEQDRQDRHRRDHRDDRDQAEPRVALTNGRTPEREPEGKTDRASRCRARARAAAGLPPVSVHSTISPVRRSGSNASASDGVGHFADRRQELVVGIGGAPLRRAEHVDHRDQHERQERQQQPCGRGWARCS